MMKYILIYLFLLLSRAIYCQDTSLVNTYWENGKQKVKGVLVSGERDGYWVEYNSNGTKSMEGNYKMGRNSGTWNYYCRHGVISKIVDWKRGLVKNITLYFPDGTQEVFIKFKDGISVGKYLEIYQNISVARNEQLKVFKKGMEIDERYFHDLAANDVYFGSTIPPSILVKDGGFLVATPIPEDLVLTLRKIEKMLAENLEDVALHLNVPMTYTNFFEDLDFYENIMRDSDGVIYHDSIIHYTIDPFTRMKHYSFVNNTLVSKVTHPSTKHWVEVCRRYFSNGQIESFGRMVNGLKQRKWKYYSLNGELLKEMKFKNDEVKKVYNYKLDDESSNGIFRSY